MNEYEHLDDGQKIIWDTKRREHLTQKSYIKDMIVNTLFRQPQILWRRMEGCINSWCFHMKIERFIKSFDSFSYYKERIVPNLSPLPKKKHIEFAKLVYQQTWDLIDENGNIPDEKRYPSYSLKQEVVLGNYFT